MGWHRQYFNFVYVQWYMYGFPWTDPLFDHCPTRVFVALSYTGDARSHHKTSTWPFRAWWSA